jgi:hypothetical protein
MAADRAPAPPPIDPDPVETIDPDEPKIAARLVELIRTAVQKTYDDGGAAKRTAFRDAHAKIVGLVRAVVRVRDDLPAELAHGVWRPGATYKAWVRFSNGDSPPKSDGARDARGMAIKLCGLPAGLGDRLPGDGEQATQDFVLIDNPSFFIKDAREYVAFVERKVGGKNVIFGFIVTATWPWRWRWRELCTMLSLLKDPPSHLAQTYHSMTPYRLGPHVVKLRARPLTEWVPRSDEQPDSLRVAMQAQLEIGDARFALEVQRRTKDTLLVEDARQVWPEADAPFEPVAELAIPPQSFTSDAQLAFGDRLSFSPWHGLLAHRPLGSLNRMRRMVYPASSSLRHQLNQTPLVEPTGDETF